MWMVFSGTSLIAQEMKRLAWVNPYIGSGGGGTEYGGTMPVVGPPFSAISWVAQTRVNKVSASSYAFEDHAISGFIGTRQPAIWMGDYGYVTVAPEIGQLALQPRERALTFQRKDEIVTPAFYSVILRDHAGAAIHAEMTATEHCSYLRFSFPTGVAGNILVEATRPGIRGFIEIDRSRNEIRGFNPDRMDARLGPLGLPNFKGYFVVQFDKLPAAWGIAREGSELPNAVSADGDNVSGYARFGAATSASVSVRVGTSLISLDQAEQNLALEIPPQSSFEDVRARLEQQWNTLLGRIELQGATDIQRRIFYTAFFHALLYPREISEHGRYYSGFDDAVHRGDSYTAFSLWDTFRAENSLLTLFVPERVDGMVRALLQDYAEGGWMPKWPNPSYTNIMIATHADSVIAEAMNKGFHGFDYATAYAAMRKDAFTPPDGDTTRRWLDREPHTPYEARGGLTYSMKLGYVPADKTAESASSTLEDAYDDAAIASVAKRLGKMDDYHILQARSLNYRNLFHAETGFMQARNSDGSWAAPNVGWTEGDMWAYTWAVQQDPQGLIDLMGGADAFNKKLDEYFAGGHHHHDNEPGHHYPYLYDFSGQPWKTQRITRGLLTKEYTDQPNGIDGNEDCGQMSAWYILSSLGFYPFDPASGKYMLTSPLFRRSILHLPHGKTFTIIARENSANNLYIQSAKLNGKPLLIPVITYQQIVDGGTLEFVMGPDPSHWAAQWRAPRLGENDGH